MPLTFRPQVCAWDGQRLACVLCPKWERKFAFGYFTLSILFLSTARGIVNSARHTLLINDLHLSLAFLPLSPLSVSSFQHDFRSSCKFLMGKNPCRTSRELNIYLGLLHIFLMITRGRQHLVCDFRIVWIKPAGREEGGVLPLSVRLGDGILAIRA